MAFDIFRALRPTVAFHVSPTRIHRPRRLADLTADKGFILRLSSTYREVCLAFGQIEVPVTDQQLNSNTGMACVKAVNEGCPLEALCQDRSAGHPNGAGEAPIARCEAALEGRHRRLDLLCGRPKFVPKLGQAITGEVSLNQPVADLLLKLCDAPLHRGLINAQGLSRCLHTACAGERKKVS